MSPINQFIAYFKQYGMTTHFWGPVANWGFVIAGLSDMQKSPEIISKNMTGVLVVYATAFARFAWMVQPRNYLLLACQVSNASVQATNLYRRIKWEQENPEKCAEQSRRPAAKVETPKVEAAPVEAAAAPAVAAAPVVAAAPTKSE